MGATPADLLLTLLAYDEARGAPLSNAPHSGYQRLEAGGGVLIMDTGRAPPIEMSLEAHAGCLSFEFSSPKQNLIVSIAACRRPRARLAAAGARHRRAFDGDVQRHVVGALRRIGGVPARARRLADARRPEPRRGDARRAARTRSCCARPRRLRRPLTASARAHADAGSRRHAARRRGCVPRRRRRRAAAHLPATNTRCASICIRSSRRPGSPTATASC